MTPSSATAETSGPSEASSFSRGARPDQMGRSAPGRQAGLFQMTRRQRARLADQSGVEEPAREHVPLFGEPALQQGRLGIDSRLQERIHA